MQAVALKGRIRTGPPWSVGRPTARAQRYRRRQTTYASEQNNTGPLGGPVINIIQSKTEQRSYISRMALFRLLSRTNSLLLTNEIRRVDSDIAVGFLRKLAVMHESADVADGARACASFPV